MFSMFHGTHVREKCRHQIRSATSHGLRRSVSPITYVPLHQLCNCSICTILKSVKCRKKYQLKIIGRCNEVRDIWCELKSPRKHQAELGMTGWQNMFAVAIWWIWKWRNDFVFKGKKMDINMKIQWIKVQYRDIMTAFSTRKVISHNKHVYEDQPIKWVPPPNEW